MKPRSTSLLEGELDEEAEAKAFKEAVAAWRGRSATPSSMAFMQDLNLYTHNIYFYLLLYIIRYYTKLYCIILYDVILYYMLYLLYCIIFMIYTSILQRSLISALPWENCPLGVFRAERAILTFSKNMACGVGVFWRPKGVFLCPKGVFLRGELWRGLIWSTPG